MKLVKISENFFKWISEKPTRNKSFIPDIDLADHCPEFWNKCHEILSDNKYIYAQKKFVRSVLEFYDDWSYITWKQYDSIMNMYIPIKRKRPVRDENMNYYMDRMSVKYHSSRVSHTIPKELFMGNALDHVVNHIDEDDLIGRFLPTEESMDKQFYDLVVSLNRDSIRKFGQAIGLY